MTAACAANVCNATSLGRLMNSSPDVQKIEKKGNAIG